LTATPAVIIAHSPTQGLDIAATASIHNALIQATNRGAAVVVISADLDELIAIADRIAVLSSGKIVDTLAQRAFRRRADRPGDGRGSAPRKRGTGRVTLRCEFAIEAPM
jgi:ABC-type uncharacterized transport system ATPase subunit